MPLLDWISSDFAYSEQGLCFRTCVLQSDQEWLREVICDLWHRKNVKKVLDFCSFFIFIIPWTTPPTLAATPFPVEWNAELVSVAVKESITKMIDAGAGTWTLDPKPYYYARNLICLRSLTARESHQMLRSFAFVIMGGMCIPRDFPKLTRGVSFVYLVATLEIDVRVSEWWLRGARMAVCVYCSGDDDDGLQINFISAGCVPTTWLKMYEVREL